VYSTSFLQRVGVHDERPDELELVDVEPPEPVWLELWLEVLDDPESPPQADANNAAASPKTGRYIRDIRIVLSPFMAREQPETRLSEFRAFACTSVRRGRRFPCR
jgi:hypothetical protein